jgi:hypothetical protein
MNGIKAIETSYQGYRFRSRLEARWAVFFDAVGLNFEYEKEGFDLGDPGYYLPDFYLSSLDTWVEIKPNGGEKDRAVIAKCHTLAVGVQKPVLLIAGSPGYSWNEYYHYPEYEMRLFGGMPWDMFDFQYPGRGLDPFEHGFMQGIDLFDRLRLFLIEMIDEGEYLTQEDAADYMVFALDEKERRKAIIELDRIYYRRKHGEEHPNRQMRVAEARWRFDAKTTPECWIDVDIPGSCDIEPEIQRGLTLARSARFEHGEHP